MQFHPFARRFLALALTAAFMTTAALSGFAVYAMPIQAAYPQESIYLFDADTGEALVEQNPDLPRCVASLTKMMTALLVWKAAPTSMPVSPSRPASRRNFSPSGPTGATPSACRPARRCAASI